MDGITQGLLGACFGQLVAGHKLGRKAIWFGVLGGVLPDFDMLARLTHGEWGSLLHHRGITHSLWFGPLVGTLLGLGFWWLFHRRYLNAGRPPPVEGELPHPGDPTLRIYWVGCMVLSIFTHPLLDAFTVYGTQLLAPFDNHRFAFNGIGIIDPIYSLVLIAALLFNTRFRKRGFHSRGRVAVAIAIVMTTGYLLHGTWLNHLAEEKGRKQLAAEGVKLESIRAYPTLFQIFLRRLVARDKTSFRIGYLSMWEPAPIAWKRVPIVGHPLLKTLRADHRAKLFDWFTMGQLLPRVKAPDKQGRTVIELDDMRYGSPEEPNKSMWGIRAHFDRSGRLLDVHRFRHPMNASLNRLKRLFRLAFGREVMR